MAFGYNPEEIVLTPEEEEAARQAAAGSTPPPAPPPPYDPAQDTQGMQAQPAPITVAPPVADPATSPEASYQQRVYQDQINQPGPEYDVQTVAEPDPVPPPTTGPTLSNGGNLVAQNTPPTQPLSSLISRTYETNGPFAPVANLLRHVGVGDLLGQYRSANQAYETGTTSPVPDQKGEALVQDLVDLGHSGLAQALAGLLPGATAAPAPYGPPPDQGQAAQLAGSGTADFVPASPSQAGPAADPQERSRYFMPAPTGDNIITTSYPATGTTTVMTKKGAVQPYYPIQVGQTYRTIPPEGSTYPERETAYGVPPRDWGKIKDAYAKGLYPDVEPRFQGEGPLGEGPLPMPNKREIPFETFSRLRKPFWKGEGNMGYRDPLSEIHDYDRPIPGLGHYSLGMGETTPYTTWRPGTGTPYTPEEEARHREKMIESGHPEMLPPEGYVPELWNAKGDTLSSYWLEKSPEPEEIPVPDHDSTGQTAPPTTPTRQLILAEMERRRRQRGLRGLFGGT